MWLEKHAIPYWDLCFVKDKPDVGADLYIEDTEKNVIALRGAGRPTIVFANVRNTRLPGVRLSNWHDVEELVLQEHERWQKNREAEFELLRVR
jgi:hypothetical protein